ncbi:DUF4149 domain-containing protein [Ramlibacter algicola]|uniref:DUF4149 domain-containing protein n=1 Tax=Ramlibacter algicola TaxID=2795217 RepID=A0A934Q032_9BURK|nr:DUF4149 domain-containing protein [Ramlibacter algicola]MBK0393604.1 DUF4149 domain-containing protein [Ramlibacter algicola]
MGWRHRVPVLAAALWWGGLTAIGALAVPLLFATLPSPALAGQAAARLFSAQAWVGLACGLVLLVASRDSTSRMEWAGGALAFVLAGMLLALLGEFAVAPRIVARENLRLWHTVGTALYALQWACALVVLWRVAGSAKRDGHPGESRDLDDQAGR